MTRTLWGTEPRTARMTRTLGGAEGADGADVRSLPSRGLRGTRGRLVSLRSAERTGDASFYYVRRFSSTNGGPDEYIAIVCRLAGKGAQSVLALEGCPCLALGVQMPVDEIVMASAEWRADVVALSVTGCMKAKLVLESLGLLRARLPADAALWVGGPAPALGRATPEGMRRVVLLEDIASAVAAWRAARGR